MARSQQVPAEMRALVVETAGNWSIEMVETPEIDDVDNVLVEVETVSICGTDPKIINGYVDGWPPSFPFIPGHEWSGRVVEVGEDVERLASGDRVFAESHHGCGHCERCREGKYNLCENYADFEAGHRQIGHTSSGTYAEYAAVPADTLYHLDEELSWREGALLDVNAIALYLTERGKVSPGDTVAVFGTGTVGLLAVQIAKAMGATTVIGVGNPQRNHLAEELGADYTISYKDDNVVKQIFDLTDGLGVDISLEAAGQGVAFRQAVEVTRKGGTVSMDGIPNENLQEIPMADLVTNEIEFRGCRAHANRADASARLVKNGRVEVDPLFTHEFDFEDFHEAYETFTERKDDAVKVALTF
ncbi:zinc-dependent alcohol dehydrogenase [Natrinema gelatinilyticum]|uniref:zinc-dependent alcohol dehydrogenase n=1 Tax=Natrinema gelatinilyticum TaxID=2961571 RepID=UPI0020C206D8|nr:alcohol dehydrogenase catalytic domain-containing protein [Natrinema gelatinilyticum]